MNSRYRGSLLGILMLAALVAGLLCPYGCSSGGGGGGGASSLGLLSFNLDSINDVFLNERLIFVFNTNVDPASVSTDTIRIRFDGSTIDRDGNGVPDNPGNTNATPPGAFTVRGNTVIFNPQLPVRPSNSDTGFVPGINYSVVLPSFPNGSVTTTNRRPLNQSFTTSFRCRLDPSFPPNISMDSFRDFFPDSPPTVAELVEPVPNGGDVFTAVDASTITDIAIRFSEPILPSTIAGGLFLRAIGPNSGREIIVSSIISIVQEAESTLVRFQPTVELPRSARIEVITNNTIRDFGSNRLELPPTISVTTIGGALVESDRFTIGGVVARASDFRFETNFLEDTDGSGALWNNPSVPGLVVATAGGTGVDGPLVLDADFVLDTDSFRPDGVNPRNGVFEFSRLVVPEGVTLRAIGSHPLLLFVSGEGDIKGIIDASGSEAEPAGSGSQGGTAGPGGGFGGVGGLGPESAGASGIGPGGGAGSAGGSGDVRASGAGGGGFGAAGSTGRTCSFGASDAPGVGGLTYGDPNLGLLQGGSGGGGAGFSLGTQGDSVAGSGGGGGGGAVLFVLGGSLGISGGAIRSDGGNGGMAATTQGASGGGGSGGGLLIRSARSIFLLPLDSGGGVIPSEVTARGGNGGSMANGRGGNGGVGRIHFETGPQGNFAATDGQTVDPPAEPGDPTETKFALNGQSSVALSLFLDTNQLFPDYVFDAATDADPPGSGTICYLFQGAPEDPDNPGNPDLDNLVPRFRYTPNIDEIDDLRFIRFAVVFKTPAGGPAILSFDDVALPRANSISLRYFFR